MLHRFLRTTRLFSVANPIYSDKLPELLDVRLMAMSPQAFTLAGFERVAGVEYAQSWLVTVWSRTTERGEQCCVQATNKSPPKRAFLFFEPAKWRQRKIESNT